MPPWSSCDAPATSGVRLDLAGPRPQPAPGTPQQCEAARTTPPACRVWDACRREARHGAGSGAGMKRLLSRALRGMAHNLHPAADGVHLHAGPAGPYACDHPGCARR